MLWLRGSGDRNGGRKRRSEAYQLQENVDQCEIKCEYQNCIFLVMYFCIRSMNNVVATRGPCQQNLSILHIGPVLGLYR